MPTYEARMRVTYTEHWQVEAKSLSEAKTKIEKLADDVITDDSGEVVDWDATKISKIED